MSVSKSQSDRLLQDHMEDGPKVEILSAKEARRIARTNGCIGLDSVMNYIHLCAMKNEEHCHFADELTEGCTVQLENLGYVVARGTAGIRVDWSTEVEE